MSFHCTICVCGCVCVSLCVVKCALDKGTPTVCGFPCCESKALGEAVNKRFSVSPKWEVPLLITRARELGVRAGEREKIELGGQLWVSTKVTVE